MSFCFQINDDNRKFIAFIIFNGQYELPKNVIWSMQFSNSFSKIQRGVSKSN